MCRNILTSGAPPTTLAIWREREREREIKTKSEKRKVPDTS